MALRISATCELKISQDNAVNPQELTFSSGSKSFVDSTNFNESSGSTFLVPQGSSDLQIELGSINLSEVMFLMAKGADLSIKLVPQGQLLADTLAYDLNMNIPAVIPFKIIEVYVSNSGSTDQVLILGAAGN